MVNVLEWSNSVGKLRSRFENASLDHPDVMLCFWNLGLGDKSLTANSMSRFCCESWSQDSSLTLLNAIGAGEWACNTLTNSDSPGLFTNADFAWCLLHQRLALAVQVNREESVIQSEIARMLEVGSSFRTWGNDIVKLFANPPRNIQPGLHVPPGHPNDHCFWAIFLEACTNYFSRESHKPLLQATSLIPEFIPESCRYTCEGEAVFGIEYSRLEINPLRASVVAIDYLLSLMGRQDYDDEDFVRDINPNNKGLCVSTPPKPTTYDINGSEAKKDTVNQGDNEVQPPVIAVENQTRVMTKSEAASKRGYKVGKGSNAAQYIHRQIKKGVNKGGMHAPMGSGQEWVFDIRDFPEGVRDSIKPKANIKL